MSDTHQTLCQTGVHEFVFGGEVSREQEYLEFWAKLGFTPVAEGGLSAKQAQSMYGHSATLRSVKLKHPGCDTYQTGYVRLQLWSELRNQGLDNAKAIICGSRWMGLYTHDIMQLHDSFSAQSSRDRWDLRLSPIVNAALQHPAPQHDFDQPFVGLRELLVFGNDFRLAFIQRGGFDRPGFGTFDDNLPFKNTEGSHANIVQPDNSFSTEFYKAVFNFETAPFGEPHDSGGEPPTIEALDLKPGELFHIERTRAVDCPSGLLQVYSSYMQGDDLRELSCPGSRNLCAYSVKVASIEDLSQRVINHGGTIQGEFQQDEFGHTALCFFAPDGYSWLATTLC